MNKKIFNIRTVLLATIALLMFVACDKKDDEDEKTRLFRPVSLTKVTTGGNWLLLEWPAMKGAIGYTVELSRDSFVTVFRSAVVDSNFVHFENLQWNTVYQVQIMAQAADAAFNSKKSFLGDVRTARFPSIMYTPTSNDVTDVAAMVRWFDLGAPATAIQVHSAIDTSLIATISLSQDDIENKEKVISGLEPDKGYLVFMYSGDAIRGWELYNTKSSIKASGPIVDLRGNSSITSLKDILTTVEENTTIIVERGMTYDMSAARINRSVTIVSGLGFADVAVLDMGTSSFNILADSQIDTLKFKDLNFKGVFASGYVMNWNTSGTINAFIFENCKIHSLRGIFRMQSADPKLVRSFAITNCIIDSISGYGILNMDNANSVTENAILRNSTFYHCERIFRSLTDMNSIVVQNCTFHRMALPNSYFIEMRNGTNVNGLITIHNSILGPAWDKNETGSIEFRPIGAGAATSMDLLNTYVTSDFTATVGFQFSPDPITYNRDAGSLWVDPAIGNFRFKDNSFSGRNTAGDPRWKP